MPAIDSTGPSGAETPEVIVVGAGPSGLMLACELALADIRTVVLERLAEPEAGPKADGLPGHAVRMVEHRGLHERLASAPGPLVAVLAERAAKLGVRIRRGHELVDLEQDSAAVVVAIAGPEGTYRLRTDYLVGADGPQSTTRTRAGIGFPGVTHPTHNARIADRLRDRRVFLVGDAAHGYDAAVDPGLVLGLTDAFNLGWKLAAAILGDAGPDLLDSYERERRPAAEQMAAQTGADPNTSAATDVRYDIGGERTSELVGRLAPKMTLQTPGGPVTLAELTTRALPLLVDLTERGSLAAVLRPWHDEVDVVRARPEAGAPSPTGLFLRPDCVVAWSSTASEPPLPELDALRAAAERWLGPRVD